MNRIPQVVCSDCDKHIPSDMFHNCQVVKEDKSIAKLAKDIDNVLQALCLKVAYRMEHGQTAWSAQDSLVGELTDTGMVSFDTAYTLVEKAMALN